MDPVAGKRMPGCTVQPVITAAACTVCGYHVGGTMWLLEEVGQLPVPRQRWMLCAKCAGAAAAEVRRAALRTPLRVRIAIGIVAAERAPRRRPRPWHTTYWKHMPESQVDRLVNRAIVLLFPIPALLFVLLATLAAAWR